MNSSTLADGPIRRGHVVLVRLGEAQGSETPGTKPCVIIQNDVGNRHSPLIIAIPLTSLESVPRLFPLLVVIKAPEGGLEIDSVADCAQILTLHKGRIQRVLGSLSRSTMAQINTALRISLGLDDR